MKHLLAPLAILAVALLPATSSAQEEPRPLPQLTLEQQMLVRCSAAFALVANRQQAGEDWAQTYPADLDSRGREFFVRAVAQVADETGAEPSQLVPLLQAQAEQLLDRQVLQGVMPACLSLLPGQTP
jgi:hypothetical protein